MASPQIENGYTRIANEIVDQFFKIRLSGNEWSILWVIMRKTYGWNKKEDNISLTQLSKETGLSRPTVVRNRDKLVRYGVLGISNATSKNKNGAKYWIKKDYENWNTGIRKDTSSNFATSTSSKSRKKLVAPTQHTKDNIQKTIKDRGKRFAPPTYQDVKEYCQERKNSVDPQRFVDFYASKGWMVGKNKMKDWKAAVRNWEKKNEATERSIYKEFRG